MKWNSQLYDTAQSYVSEYGKGLIEFIPIKDNISILDLGCGTGDLTKEIYQRSQSEHVEIAIMGVDSSLEMIQQAKKKYPHISFEVCGALDLPFINQFDVIFSNAVFHWIPKQKELHAKIYQALKEKGILVCEFGASNNIEQLSTTFNTVLEKYNDSYVSHFYFPTVKEHTGILNAHDFHIDNIYDFDRPTKLPNGIDGLKEWVSQFFSAKLQQFSKDKQEDIFNEMKSQLQSTMYDGEAWIADYRRLRVIAHK